MYSPCMECKLRYGKEYTEQCDQKCDYANFEFVCDEYGCDGWRSQADIVSWKYDNGHK